MCLSAQTHKHNCVLALHVSPLALHAVHKHPKLCMHPIFRLLEHLHSQAAARFKYVSAKGKFQLIATEIMLSSTKTMPAFSARTASAPMIQPQNL